MGTGKLKSSTQRETADTTFSPNQKAEIYSKRGKSGIEHQLLYFPLDKVF